ncbi:MAG: GTP-binding protein [Hormoscilla sp. GUM202]|nr:GTP-binding protein [Hormoscilla sp. GUM202]
METITQKICLVGDYGVGKTSIISRFVERQFSDEYLSNVGVKISRKTLELTQAKVHMLIWDLEGSTKFQAIVPTYLQGAMGAIIVADISRQETLEGLREHIERFLSINPQGLIIISLNKSDLFDPLEVGELVDRIQFKDQEQVLATYATSAKTGQDVDLMFETLADRLI